MAKFKFSQKLEIRMPKVQAKADTKKMQIAFNKAITKGAQKGATYVEADLKKALDNSMDTPWSWISGSRDIVGGSGRRQRAGDALDGRY